MTHAPEAVEADATEDTAHGPARQRTLQLLRLPMAERRPRVGRIPAPPFAVRLHQPRDIGVIGHGQKHPPSRAQHTRKLRRRAFGVGEVLEGVDTEHGVERPVCERQPRAIGQDVHGTRTARHKVRAHIAPAPFLHHFPHVAPTTTYIQHRPTVQFDIQRLEHAVEEIPVDAVDTAEWRTHHQRVVAVVRTDLLVQYHIGLRVKRLPM